MKEKFYKHAMFVRIIFKFLKNISIDSFLIHKTTKFLSNDLKNMIFSFTTYYPIGIQL